MNLIEIENLTAAELKQRRGELAIEAAKADVAELAARYVQARADASARDEKLAEQGRTIASLQDALASQKQATEAMQAKVHELAERLRRELEAHDQAVARINALTESNQNLSRQLAAALDLARKRRAALLDVLDFASQVNAKVGKLLVTEE